jgi:hypothetical protein
MMLLGEISELSLEPAIEGRFDRSKYVVPIGVAKKYVDAFSERQILKKNWRRCSLVRRGRSAAWGRTVRDLAQVSGPLLDDRTVRACAGAAEVAGGGLDLAPGRDPVGKERF